MVCLGQYSVIRNDESMLIDEKKSFIRKMET